MTELHTSEQLSQMTHEQLLQILREVPPKELQKPPVFTDAEADSLLQVQADIAATRLDADGNPVLREYAMGVTYDGKVVSVDEHPGSVDESYFVVRVGDVSQLTQGVPLPEQKIPLSSYGVERDRGNGATILMSEFGGIGVPQSIFDEPDLPSFEGRVLFPIGEDGKPFSPAAKREAELLQQSAASQSEQVSLGGIRKLLRRRK
jgi:hypothetical protein